jgi:hypothetical protein
LIFSHAFAKALWGEEPQYCSQCKRTHHSSSDCDCGGWPISAIPAWQHRIEQLVLESNPLNYLMQFVDKEN